MCCVRDPHSTVFELQSCICSRPPQHNLRDPAGTLTVVSAANDFFLSVKNEVNRNWACNAVFAAREGNIRHVEVPRAQAF